MTRKKLLKFSLCQFIISAVTFIINYFFYHFVTDSGITTTFQSEPGKPFVANLIGFFATLFLFSAVTALVMAFVFFEREENNKNEEVN